MVLPSEMLDEGFSNMYLRDLYRIAVQWCQLGEVQEACASDGARRDKYLRGMHRYAWRGLADLVKGTRNYQCTVRKADAVLRDRMRVFLNLMCVLCEISKGFLDVCDTKSSEGTLTTLIGEVREYATCMPEGALETEESESIRKKVEALFKWEEVARLGRESDGAREQGEGHDDRDIGTWVSDAVYGGDGQLNVRAFRFLLVHAVGEFGAFVLGQRDLVVDALMESGLIDGCGFPYNHLDRAGSLRSVESCEKLYGLLGVASLNSSIALPGALLSLLPRRLLLLASRYSLFGKEIMGVVDDSAACVEKAINLWWDRCMSSVSCSWMTGSSDDCRASALVLAGGGAGNNCRASALVLAGGGAGNEVPWHVFYGYVREMQEELVRSEGLAKELLLCLQDSVAFWENEVSQSVMGTTSRDSDGEQLRQGECLRTKTPEMCTLYVDVGGLPDASSPTSNSLVVSYLMYLMHLASFFGGEYGERAVRTGELLMSYYPHFSNYLAMMERFDCEKLGRIAEVAAGHRERLSGLAFIVRFNMSACWCAISSFCGVVKEYLKAYGEGGPHRSPAFCGAARDYLVTEEVYDRNIANSVLSYFINVSEAWREQRNIDETISIIEGHAEALVRGLVFDKDGLLNGRSLRLLGFALMDKFKSEMLGQCFMLGYCVKNNELFGERAFFKCSSKEMDLLDRCFGMSSALIGQELGKLLGWSPMEEGLHGDLPISLFASAGLFTQAWHCFSWGMASLGLTYVFFVELCHPFMGLASGQLQGNEGGLPKRESVGMHAVCLDGLWARFRAWLPYYFGDYLALESVLSLQFPMLSLANRAIELKASQECDSRDDVDEVSRDGKGCGADDEESLPSTSVSMADLSHDHSEGPGLHSPR